MTAEIIPGWKGIIPGSDKITVAMREDGAYVVDVSPTTIGDGSGDMLKSVYDANNNGVVDAAESVEWGGVVNVPSTFPPSAHDHDERYYTETELGAGGQANVHWDNLTNVPSAFPPSAHDHDGRYYTETETDALLGERVARSLFDANTILKADNDDTPSALSVPASTIVGRGASGGIAALNASSARTVLGLATTSSVVFGRVSAANTPVALPSATAHMAFEGSSPYNLDFTGSNLSHLGVAGSPSGGVIYRPGRYGKAVQMAPATTNLVTNPSFETDTSGWTNYSTGTATGNRARVAGAGLYGDYAYRLEKTGGNATETDRWGTYCTVNVVSGQTYTFSVWIRVESISGGGLATRVYIESNVPGTSAYLYGAGDWRRASITVTATGTGTANLYIWNGSASTATIYIDGVQVEQQPVPTPYCDGSLGPGHSWSGTPHASTSSRTAATLTYANNAGLNGDEGTIMMWCRHDGVHPNGMGLFGTGANAQFDVYISSAGSTFFRQNGTTLSHASGVQPNTWYHYAFTWSKSANTRKIFVNGVEVASRQFDSGATLGSVLYVGSIAAGGAYSVNGLLDEFVLLDYVAPPELIYQVYASNAPLLCPTALSREQHRSLLGLATTDTPQFAGVTTEIIAPTTDTTSAVRITNAAQSSTVLSIDTVNGRMGINASPPAFRLDVRENNNGIVTLASFRNLSSGTSAGVQIQMSNDLMRMLELGILSSTHTAYAGYGEPGDAFLYCSANAGNFNFFAANTNKSIRFYGGRYATQTPSFIIKSSSIGVDVTTPTFSSGEGIDIGGATLRLRTSRTPASATASGNVGELCWDANQINMCTATNTWKRAELIPLVGQGAHARFVNACTTPTTHFNTGTLPTNHSWQGTPFVTPATVSYWKSDYLYLIASSTPSRHFLAKQVDNQLSSWANKAMVGRFGVGTRGRFGLRFDDGSDNNYAEIWVTGEAANGTVTVSFRYRQNAGTPVINNVATVLFATEIMTIRLLCHESSGSISAYGYLLTEDSRVVNISGFSSPAFGGGVFPANGRAGIFFENTGVANPVVCDWYYTEF